MSLILRRDIHFSHADVAQNSGQQIVEVVGKAAGKGSQ